MLAHGFTAEQLWRQLTNIKQGDESFRQLVWRATTKLQQFFKLAVTDTLSVDLILDTLLKYFVLEGCSDELRAHFLERKLPSISCEEFQEIGSSFQEARRWEKSLEQYLFKSDESTTMNAWIVLTEETVSKLQKMSINDRRTYVFEKRLCFNCLLPGHRGSSCRSAKRCTRCNSKHHTLLHQNNNPKKPNEEAQVNMVSSHVDHHGIAKIGQPTDVLLMTTVVDVIGHDQERHRVRVFFDQGSQASFVSTNLVNQVSAQKLRDTLQSKALEQFLKVELSECFN